MKQLFLSTIILLSVISFSCKKKCHDLVDNMIDVEAKQYFNVYSDKEVKYIYTNNTLQDTLFISATTEVRDTEPEPYCIIKSNQIFFFRGKNFIDSTVIFSLSGYGPGTNFRCTNANEKKIFYGFDYERNTKKLKFPEDPVLFLEYLFVGSQKYTNVLFMRNSLIGADLYFAPNKGLVRWKYKNNIYDLKT